jgi:hypothetical protein
MTRDVKKRCHPARHIIYVITPPVANAVLIQPHRIAHWRSFPDIGAENFHKKYCVISERKTLLNEISNKRLFSISLRERSQTLLMNIAIIFNKYCNNNYLKGMSNEI